MSTPKTPRLRSAFPLSPPQSSEKSKTATPFPLLRSRLPVRGSPTPASNHTTYIPSNGPAISLSTLDGPTQRLYVAAVYFLLIAWKLYDYFGIVAQQSSSIWLFMKWTAIDGVFLYGLPGLRIPWLEWSALTITMLFLGHACTNAVLMFRIPIPVEGWLVAIGKVFYDRELAITERRVKAASLVQNSSLILGKQIIHILPEGSAVLNSESESFCVGDGRAIVLLPLLVNQTIPTSVELLRSDFDTATVESIVLSSKEVKKLRKEADRELAKQDLNAPKLLKIPVKQTGLYRLGRVTDESNLEVQRTQSEALVVRCPSASMKLEPQHRCRGELSNFFIEVDATPPLRIDYTRTINRGDESSISLTWHPEELDSPLLAWKDAPSATETANEQDISWARSRRHRISVNETMGTSGGWQYRIDRVQDGCGNVMDYTRTADVGSSSWSSRSRQLEQDFIVHQRPKAKLQGCSAERPLLLPGGDSVPLPVVLNPSGLADAKLAKHHVRYSFSPLLDENQPDEQAESVRYEMATFGSDGQGPVISNPGIYKLQSISTDFCGGEILEPSSCILVNPPRPDAAITYDEIPDKCAGHSVGILVSLDLVGSPPFTLYYSEQRRGGPLVHKSVEIGNLRHQLTFEPHEAGHYTYSFNEIADSVYKRPRQLGPKGKSQKLEQDIKPMAWARFESKGPRRRVCLDQKASFHVLFTGEGPWSLEYDLIHGKSRQKKRLEGIESERLEIETPELTRGGVYSITLKNVIDRSGCKIYLDQEAQVEVRQEKPTVGFAHVEGERSTRSLHGQKVRLPLRLSGEGPWTVTYIAGDGTARKEYLATSNAFLETTEAGTYLLQEVSDSACPGVVDLSASTFDIYRIDRPNVDLAPSDRIERSGRAIVKHAVCEGEQDSLDVTLAGNGPFQLEYQVSGRLDHGSHFTSTKKDVYASSMASFKMQTVKAGVYRYSVMGVADQFYDMTKRKEPVVVVEQRVHSRPSASFANAGRTYSYCKEDHIGTEAIPVVLTGKPPFVLEIGIKHQASSRPEIVTFSGIRSQRYDVQVPKSSLALGGYSVSILRTVDGNGCQYVKDRSDRELVHVNVVDVPTIAPMESRTDYCVGDRISFTLAGTPPFNVFYSFEDIARKAAVAGTDFRRLAEKPGVYTINAVSDRTSTDACRARTNLTKIVHELPSVRISRGKTQEVDIHEGGEAEILFEFGGTPPFEFTYTRSTNAVKGKRSVVLETKHDVSSEYTKSIRAYEEGTYEVVSIRDKYCGVTLQGKTSDQASRKLPK